MFNISRFIKVGRLVSLALVATTLSFAAETPKAGTYAPYSEKAAAAPGRTVLFFHADWCPTCRAADKAFKAESGKIPADVNLLVVDFDSQVALKKKYGVTSQSTFVQVDGKGVAVKKWMGSQSVGDLIAKIKASESGK